MPKLKISEVLGNAQEIESKILTPEEMKKVSALATLQANQDQEFAPPESILGIPVPDVIDNTAVTNPHKKSSKIARTSKEQNFTASSSMGVSTKNEGKMEDRLYVGVVQNIGQVSPEQIPQILYESNMKFGNPKAKHWKSWGWDGSTAVTCIVYKDRKENKKKIIVSNVGDSRAVIIKRKRNAPLFTECQRLTPTLSPSNREEKQRLKLAGSFIASGRINGLLSVSRAFGDFTFKGVSYEPHIPETITVEVDEEAHVVLFSDGIYEGGLFERELLIIFNEVEKDVKEGKIQEKDKNDVIANKIRQAAENRKKDNKTVLIIPVDQPALKEDEAVLGIVADGHGGESTSNLVVTLLPQITQAEINKKIQLENTNNHAKAAAATMENNNDDNNDQAQNKSGKEEVDDNQENTEEEKNTDQNASNQQNLPSKIIPSFKLTPLMQKRSRKKAQEQAIADNNAAEVAKGESDYYCAEELDRTAQEDPHKNNENKHIDAFSSAGASEKYGGMMEDGVDVRVVENLDLVNPNQIPQILLDAKLRLGAECYENEINRPKSEQEKKLLQDPKIKLGAGSTAVACLIYNRQNVRHIFVSNVGDSRAVILRRKKNSGEKFSIERLTETHTLIDPDEKARIKAQEKNGAFITEGATQKLNDLLSMSRALGDPHVGPGVTWAPSIPTPTIIGADEEAYVVLFTDGIYDKLYEIDICNIFNNEKIKPEDRAQRIRQTAEKRRDPEGGRERKGIDNKLDIIINTEQPNLTEGQGTAVVVTDSHGAPVIPEPFVGNHINARFAPIVQEEINKTCKRYFEFINEVEERIKQLEDEPKKRQCFSFFQDSLDNQLRKDKIAILKMYIAIVKAVKPQPEELSELIKDIGTLKLCDIGNQVSIVNMKNDCFEVEKSFWAKYKIEKPKGEYAKDCTVYDLLCMRRVFNFFNVLKPSSARLIDKYSKPTQKEKYDLLINVESYQEFKHLEAMSKKAKAKAEAKEKAQVPQNKSNKEENIDEVASSMSQKMS